MMELELSAAILGIALLAGAILLLMVTMLGAKRETPPSDSAAQHSTSPVFLFDGQELIDCNSAARVILGHSNIQGSDWQKLLAFLSPYFTALEGRLGTLAKMGAIAETGAAENGKIIL
ncbi:MAG: PAS domain-containing protein, partial [Cypionkella sp.]